MLDRTCLIGAARLPQVYWKKEKSEDEKYIVYPYDSEKIDIWKSSYYDIKKRKTIRGRFVLSIPKQVIMEIAEQIKIVEKNAG